MSRFTKPNSIKRLEEEKYYENYHRRFLDKQTPLCVEQRQVNFYSHGTEYCINIEAYSALDEDQIDDIRRVISQLL